jgi:RNA polymerase primary sigma factor
LVAAPRLLDEGVNVPSADLAIVLATSRSRRQLVQRMGRVIRKKADGREARLVVLFVAGTTEDPGIGAHEDFLDEIGEAAAEVKVFRPRSPSGAIAAWLRPRLGRR